MVISIAVGLILIFCGVAIKYFKWYFLIAGYNTASQKTKENIDVEALGSFMGKMLFISGGLLILSGILHHYEYRLLSTAMIFLMTISIFYMILKSPSYSKNTVGNSIDKAAVWVACGVIIIIIVLLVLPSAMPSEITLEDTQMRVAGISGDTFSYDRMMEIKLLDEIPKFRKVAGINLGNINKGSFRVGDWGVGRLYLHSGKSPFLYIKLEGDRNFVIINFRDKEKTLQLYEELLGKYRAANYIDETAEIKPYDIIDAYANNIKNYYM